MNTMTREERFERKRAEQQRNIMGAIAIDKAIRPIRNELEKEKVADRNDRNKANFRSFIYYCLSRKSKKH